MKISTFKFGNTPLFYTPDGAIARGIIYPKRSFWQESIQWIFSFSAALLILVVLFSSGRSMLARAQYTLAPVMHTVTNSTVMRKFLSARTVAALLPMSATKTVLDTSDATVSKANLVTVPTIAIPKLGVSAPIVESFPDLTGIDTNLQKGVVRWPESAKLGTSGVTVLLGHSSAPLSYHGAYGAIFALLDKLDTGDLITITSADGQMLTYRVHDHIVRGGKQYDINNFGFGSGHQLLVLISCWPVGTTWKRIAVRAEWVP